MVSKTQRIGSKRQVWHGTALQTAGGLTKKDLVKNKRGKIVSRRKHIIAKRHTNLPELIRKP